MKRKPKAKPQWKGGGRRKVFRDAARRGLRFIYEAFDLPPEPWYLRGARKRWNDEQLAKNKEYGKIIPWDDLEG